MPKKTFKVEEVEGNRKLMGRGNRFLHTLDVETIAKESGSNERWVPETKDELEDLREVLLPLSPKMTEYVCANKAAKDYVWDTDGAIDQFMKYTGWGEKAGLGVNSEKDKDDMRKMMYSDLLKNDGSLNENIRNYYRAVRTDMREALKNNKFYSPENIEKNFGSNAVKYVKDLADFISLDGPDAEIPNMVEINRLIDLKRGLLETINPFGWSVSDEKKKYVQEEKAAYDALQKYDYLKENGKDDEAARYKNDVIIENVAWLNEKKSRYLNACVGKFSKFLDMQDERLDNGRKRTALGWKCDNSPEYSEMMNSLRAYNQLTVGDSGIKTDVDKDSYAASLNKLRTSTINYLKHLYENKPEKLTMIDKWDKNDIDESPITDELIEDLKNTRKTTDGKNRIEVALKILREIKNNEELVNIYDVTRIDPRLEKIVEPAREPMNYEEVAELLGEKKAGITKRENEADKSKNLENNLLK